MFSTPHKAHHVGRFALLGWSVVLAPMSIVGVWLFSLLFATVLWISVWVGIPLTVCVLPWTRGFANWHRDRLGALSGLEIPRPYLQLPPTRGWIARLRVVAKDPATGRDTVWLLLNGLVGCVLCTFSVGLFAGGVFYVLMPAFWALWPNALNETYGLFTVHSQSTSCLTIPIGLIALLVWWWASPRLIRADARLARTLLGPAKRSRLERRAAELAASRADAVDTHAAELRRVERDLHDGAQARLVALGMSLGMADQMLDHDPDQARALLAAARDETGAALTDLRNLVRGIYPPVLAERGLRGAIDALALALPIPVQVSVDLPAGRLSEPVESAAYFALSEVLANIIKHSGAHSATIQANYANNHLRMIVSDDGAGGATVTTGGGMDGIRRRLGTFDGALIVTSPPGGPTTVRMNVPCELSSLKI